MNERGRDRGRLLPGASGEFTQAMLEAANRIRVHEMKRRRRARALAVAAAALLVLTGFGATLTRLSAPRPDEVALSANPDRLVPREGEATAAPEATPEPTPEATPEPEQEDAPRSRVDEESGWEYLLDDGPFEEGEWLVLTDADGCMGYRLSLPFYERPSQNARLVYAVSGMQVRYLSDAGNGFAHVVFAGQEGYVDAAMLRRGAPRPTIGANLLLDSATLFVVDAVGTVHTQFIENLGEQTLSAYALQKLLDSLAPAEGVEADGLAFNALLVARYVDPEDDVYESGAFKAVDVRLNLSDYLSRETPFLLMDEAGTLYEGSAVDEALFDSIFSELQ